MRALFIRMGLVGSWAAGWGSIVAPSWALDEPPLRNEEQNLTPADGAELDKFGDDVAVEADTLLMTAPSHYSNELAPGSIYAFTRGADGRWVREDRLFSSDGALGDEFGHRVALSGDTFIAGAPFSDAFGDHTGSAYIFEREPGGPWMETLRLLPDVTGGPQRFGKEVAIEGAEVFVAAPTEAGVGAIYVYRRNAQGFWSRVDKIVPESGRPGFNDRLTVQGETLVVGADLFDMPAVHVYERDRFDAWGFKELLLISDPEPGSMSPRAIALDGSRMALGVLSFGEDRVYVFEHDVEGHWTQTGMVRSPDRLEGNFGAAIDLRGDSLVVGAPHDGSSGTAYLFRRDAGGTWNESLRFRPAVMGVNDNFGRAIALSGRRILVGAPAADPRGDSSGAAYSFRTLVKRTSGIPVP